MATDVKTITDDYLSVSWRAPRVSEALNAAMMSDRPRVVRGFSLAPSALALTVTAEVDPVAGDSVLLAGSGDGLLSYREEAGVEIDLTAQAGLLVFLGVVVTYSVGSDTTGVWRTYSSAEIQAGDHVTDGAVMLGTVNVPGAGVIDASDILLGGLTETLMDDSFGQVRRIEDGEGLKRLSLVEFHDLGHLPSGLLLGTTINTAAISYVDKAAGFGSRSWGFGAGDVVVLTGRLTTAIQGSAFLVAVTYRTTGYTEDSPTQLGLTVYDGLGSVVETPALTLPDTALGAWETRYGWIEVTHADAIKAEMVLAMDGSAGLWSLNQLALWRVNENQDPGLAGSLGVEGDIPSRRLARRIGFIDDGVDLSEAEWEVYADNGDLRFVRATGDVHLPRLLVDEAVRSSNSVAVRCTLSLDAGTNTVALDADGKYNANSVSAGGGSGDAYVEIDLSQDLDLTSHTASWSGVGFAVHILSAGDDADYPTIFVPSITPTKKVRVDFRTAAGAAKTTTNFADDVTISLVVFGVLTE